jgi:hypothetical protein
MHWLALLIGYLLGSFIGLQTLLGFVGGFGKAKAAPAPMAA